MKKIIVRRLISSLFVFLLAIWTYMPVTLAADYAGSGLPTQTLLAAEANEEDTISTFKAEIIRLVNAEREKAQVAPLTQLDILFTMADVRAEESSVSFKHTRPDGTRCFTIFGDYGLTYKAAGENLAAGYKTPAKIVNAWMNSETHRDNILDPDFTYIGIGYFIDATGRLYCSQLFYTPTEGSQTAQASGSQTASSAPADDSQSDLAEGSQTAPVLPDNGLQINFKAQLKYLGLIK